MVLMSLALPMVMQGWIKTVLESSALIYIGRISYGLYVYHNFMPGIVKLFYAGGTVQEKSR